MYFGDRQSHRCRGCPACALAPESLKWPNRAVQTAGPHMNHQMCSVWAQPGLQSNSARSKSAGALAGACFGALGALLQPCHGNVRETAALILRPMTPGILGTAATPGGGTVAPARSPAAIRAGVLEFARDTLQCALCTLCCGVHGNCFCACSECAYLCWALNLAVDSMFEADFYFCRATQLPASVQPCATCIGQQYQLPYSRYWETTEGFLLAFDRRVVISEPA